MLRLSIVFQLFSFLVLTHCNTDVQVERSSVQVDTLRYTLVSEQSRINGRVIEWYDSIYAPFAGKVEFKVSNGDEVEVGDTLFYIRSRSRFNSEGRVYNIGRQLKQMNERIAVIDSYLSQLERGHIMRSLPRGWETNEPIATVLVDYKLQMNEFGQQLAKNRSCAEELLRTEMAGILMEIEVLKQELQKLQRPFAQLAFLSDHAGIFKGEHLSSDVPPGGLIAMIKLRSEQTFCMHVSDCEQFYFDDFDLCIDGVPVKCSHINEHVLYVQWETKPAVQLGFGNEVVINSGRDYRRALIAKKSALMTENKMLYVFKFVGSEASKVAVRIRPFKGEFVEIVDGVTENDQIIVSSSQPIWSASKVRIIQ